MKGPCVTDCELKYPKYIKRLVKYIKENSRKHQVVIISNTELKSADKIARQILLEVPGFLMNLKKYKNARKNDLTQLSVFGDPEATTIFILISESLEFGKPRSDIPEILDLMTRWSPARIRPKCLIIPLCDNKSYIYDNLLRYMWSQRFLDVTIVQFREENIPVTELQRSCQLKIMLHHFNPFTNVYKKTKYSRKIEWFPDKLRDMNGFPIKGGLINLPPYSIVHFNNTRHPVSYSGAEYLTFMAISKALHFAATIITSFDAKIGVEDIENKTATGMIGKCVNNEINIFITTLMPLNSKKESLTETTRMLELASLYAIVPSLPAENHIVEDKNLLYMSLLVFFSAVILIYVASRLFKFNQHLWKPEDIIQLLLGFSVPNQPGTLYEKFVFTSGVIISMCYASTFFAGITSTNLDTASKEMEFNSFEDLNASGLRVVVHPNLMTKVFGEADGALLDLQKMCIEDENLMTSCVRDLVQHKNVSCILAGCTSMDVVEGFRDASGHSPVKIMKQSFWTTSSVMYMEKGSPYVKCFDNVLIRIIEAGLRQKWTGNYSRDLSASDTTDRQVSDFKNVGKVTNLRRRLIFVTLHGFMISIIAFVGEIFLHYAKNFLYPLRKKSI